MTNWPAFRFFAILGASISNFLIFSAKKIAETILYIVLAITRDMWSGMTFSREARQKVKAT
jgi:hypothetical protein